MILILLQNRYQILLHQLCPQRLSYSIYEALRSDYNILVCPSGGSRKHTLLRVGHIGMLTIADNDKLFLALSDLKKEDLMKALLLAAGRGTRISRYLGQAKCLVPIRVLV